MTLLQIEDEIDSAINLTHAVMLMTDAILKTDRDTGNALAELAVIIDQKLTSARDALHKKGESA